MIIVLLLTLGCSGDSPRDSAVTDCDYEHEVITLLPDWDTATSVGPTARDYFGFVVGTLEIELHWDDAVVSPASLVVTGIDADEISYGDPEQCVGPGIQVRGMFELVSEDGRLEVAGEFGAGIEDVQPVAEDSTGVWLLAEVGTFAVASLDPTSTIVFSAKLESDAALDGAVFESWSFDTETERECERAAINRPTAPCTDRDSNPGSI